MEFFNGVNRRKFIKQLGVLGISVSASSFLMDVFDAYGFERLKESSNYQKLDGKKIQCFVCPMTCILNDGETCFCRTRTNIGGVLYEDSYGYPCVLNIDPIEKGPLYHVMPSIKGLAFGTAGCVLRCIYCQNWQASQITPVYAKNIPMSVNDVVNKTVSKDLKAVIFTYTEPIMFFDYAIEISELAKRKGLLTHCCTSGFVSEEPLKQLCKNMDSFTIALKGFSDEFYSKVCGQRLSPVLDSLQTVKAQGKWLEIVNLIVPTLNDETETIRKMCKWIVGNLGTDVPIHFARFFPSYKLQNLPQTPQLVLEEARKIARDCGIKYVYIANLPGHEGNNTFCPGCKKEIIQRSGFNVLKNNVIKGKCKFCQTNIPGVWEI